PSCFSRTLHTPTITTHLPYTTLFPSSDKQDVPNNQQFSFVSPVRKFFSLLGVISSIGFFLLLVTPGSPGFLSTPSWIALIVWISLGALFFAIRFKNYRSILKKELDYLVLGEYSESKKASGDESVVK